MSTRLNQPIKGITFAVFAVFVLTLQDAFVKMLTSDFSVVQILCVRSAMMSIPIFFLVLFTYGWVGFHTHRPIAHLLRLSLNMMAFLAFFFGLSRLPLADAIALLLSAPIFMALLSGPLLGERVTGRLWVVIVVGFVGVVLMANPTAKGADLVGVGAILGASVAYALWMLHTRYLSSTERSETMVFYTAVGSATTTALIMPMLWRQPSAGELGLLALLGIMSSVGHFCLVQAYRYAPVYVVGPFDYTSLVWGILIGYIVWRDMPSAQMLAGATLVVAGGLYLFHRQRRISGSTREGLN